MNSSEIKRLCVEAKAKHVQRMRDEIVSVIRKYTSLRVVHEMYTYVNGVEEMLVTLVGTIPIFYRKNTYNIPIAVYIKNDFPYSAPFCYVRPTANMNIKESKNVDNQGFITLPYIDSWCKTSTLCALLEMLIIVFSEMPPVYQKPAEFKFTQYPTSSVSYPNPYSGGSYWSQPGQYPTATNSNTAISNSNSMSNDISDNDIRVSLLSAVADKLKERLTDRIEQYTAEMEVLTKTGEDLNNSKREVENIIRKMESDIKTLEEAQKKIESKDAQLDEAFKKLEDSDNQVNVDDTYGPNEPIYKQLLNTFAEENSIADVIYYLSEALKKGIVDLDTFLKHVRELSRRQFMLRALMQKCREKAGLPY